MGAAKHGIGVARLNLGQTAEAIQSLEAALPLRRDASDRLGEASRPCWSWGGPTKTRNPERAVLLINQALQIAEQVEAVFRTGVGSVQSGEDRADAETSTGPRLDQAVDPDPRSGRGPT